MANGIRIDELDATVLPSRDHVVPAMKDGLTVKLTVGQILDLLGKVLDPDEVGSKALFAALNLSDLDDPAQARANIAALSYESQSLNSSQKAQARANINAPERIVLDVVAPGGAGVGGAVPLTLSNSKAYTIRLNTTGTGTKTGAVYNLWYDGSAWNLKQLAGIIEPNQNHPELRLNSNGDGLEVFTQHANDYTIRLHIDVWDTFNSSGISERFFNPAVSYTPQTLSPTEQSQARANIDALGPNETADRAFRRGNILGTVSQSGGVPTGAIIEFGINANGAYVRFADGTQICRVTGFGAFQTNNASGTDGISVSQDVTWTFPAPFVSTPTVHPAADASNRLMTQFSASPLISVVLRMYAIGGTSPTNVTANVLATGRWF